MKRLICAFLSLTLIFSFAACGNNKKQTSSSDVDLEYYANLGQIPECPYKLGEDIDKINSELSAKYESEGQAGEDTVYEVTEGEKTVRIDSGDFIYYYVKDKKGNGVSFIVSLDKAYGFETGTPLLEVKNSLAGFEYKEENADDSNSFFLLGEQDATVLKYSFEENSVLFVFSDNSLTAVAVYSTENWNV